MGCEGNGAFVNAKGSDASAEVIFNFFFKKKTIIHLFLTNFLHY